MSLSALNVPQNLEKEKPAPHVGLEKATDARSPSSSSSLKTGVSWVQWRYGFTAPTEASTDRECTPNTDTGTPRPDWFLVLNAGGTADGVPAALVPHLRALASGLTTSIDNLNTQNWMAPYLDILPGNPAYLDPAQPNVESVRNHSPSHHAYDHDAARHSARLGVQRMVLSRPTGETVVYRLLPERASSEARHPWIFAVDDAALVVLALRSGCGVSRDSLVRFFVQHQLPFHTLALKRPGRSESEKPVGRLPELATLLTGFDADDLGGCYERYEQAREAFFSSARGKAMARYGGVIRRLYALNAAEAEVRLGHIIAGPTELAFLLGNAFSWNFNGRSLTLCEDTLTAAELGFVCGTYALSGNAKKSWYKPLAVDIKQHPGASGGIWHNGDEIKFRKRVEEILAGTRGPLTAEEWKRASKSGNKADIAYEHLCERYVCDYIRIQAGLGIVPVYSDLSSVDHYVPMAMSRS